MSASWFARISHSALAAVASFALAPAALATTWIVDQHNGPNTNFTSIPPAIAAAAPGDVILVRTGGYGSFTLGRGITLIGQGNVVISGTAAVNAVPAAEVAALDNLNMNGPIQVDSCTGTVLLSRLSYAQVFVQGSADVRIFLMTAWPMTVIGSRVQFVQSNTIGIGGQDAVCTNSVPATPGSYALTCSGPSRVHFALSSAHGGNGGWGDFDIACNYNGEAGGNGITTVGPAGGLLELILANCQITAGFGGSPGGSDGKSLLVGANVTAWSSQTTYAPHAPVVAGGTLIQQPTAEPTLELIGTPAPGSLITVRLHATPGMSVRLNMGKVPIVQATPGILVEALVQKERSFDRGLVPGAGVLDTPWVFVPTAPLGKLLIFQARLVDPGTGLIQRSNSIEAIVQ